MSFSSTFLHKSIEMMERLDTDAIEKMVEKIAQLKEREGRLFIAGSGGGAGHASHATCDFRKICNVEAYAPYDNVSELTARVNDEGWDTTLVNWLKGSRFSGNDGLLIFSVGGGSQEKNVSMNLVNAMIYAREKQALVCGIVGKNGGFCAQVADACVILPEVDGQLVTPITEGFQAVIWHLVVSHPRLQVNAAKWESLTV